MAADREIEKLLLFLAAAYPGRFQVVNLPGPDGESVSTANVFQEVLADVPFEAVRVAARQYVAEGHEYPPSAGQLRKLALALVTPSAPAWADAWEEIKRQISLVGSYGAPVFSHPLVAQAVKAYGWKDVCAMEIGDSAAFAQLRNIYEGYARRAETEARYLPDVRAVAAQHGTLQALPEPTRPALPAPVDRTARPDGMGSEQPLRFVEYMTRSRAERAEQAAAAARAKVAAWQAEQGGR